MVSLISPIKVTIWFMLSHVVVVVVMTMVVLTIINTWCAGPATKRGPLGWHAGFLSCRNLLNSKRMTRGVRCAGPATELGLHLLPFSSPHLAFCIFSSVHPSDVHAGLLSQVSSCATNASSAYPSLHPGIHASRVVRVSRALSTPKCIAGATFLALILVVLITEQRGESMLAGTFRRR